MRFHIKTYRRLLGLYPPKFRHKYGDEMALLFADLLAGQRRSPQPLGTLRIWVHTIGDTLANSTREHMEETMKNQVAVTRLLLFAFPIAFVATYVADFAGGFPLSLLVLVVGAGVLVVRRRSLPDAIFGSRRGKWWLWTLGGLAMIGTAIGLSLLSAGDDSEDTSELGWMLFSLLFMAGTLIVVASIIGGLAHLLRRPRAS